MGPNPGRQRRQRVRRRQEHGRHQLRRCRHAAVPDPAQVLYAQSGVVHHQLLPERQPIRGGGHRLQLLPTTRHQLAVHGRPRRRWRRVVDVQRHASGREDDQVPDHRRRPGDLGQARWQDLTKQQGAPGRLPGRAVEVDRADPGQDPDRQVRRRRPDAGRHEERLLGRRPQVRRRLRGPQGHRRHRRRRRPRPRLPAAAGGHAASPCRRRLARPHARSRRGDSTPGRHRGAR